MIETEIIYKDNGSLEEVGAADILMYLYKKSATGMLRIEQNEIIKVIYLKEGNIAFASSNDQNDRLGEVLIKLKKITRDQLNDAMHRLKPNISLGKMLVQLGYLSGKDLLLGAQRQAELIIISVFSWEKGNYSFIEGPLPKQLVDLKLETPRIIVQGIMSNATKKWVLKHIISMEQLFKLKEGYEDVYKALQLSQEADIIIDKLDGTMTLSEISATTNLDDFQICKIIASLIILGIVERIEKPSKYEEKISEELKPLEKIEVAALFEKPKEVSKPEEEKVVKEEPILVREEMMKEVSEEKEEEEKVPEQLAFSPKDEEMDLIIPERARNKRKILAFLVPLSFIVFGAILLLLFWKLKSYQTIQSYFSAETIKREQPVEVPKEQKNEITVISIPSPKESKEIQEIKVPKQEETTEQPPEKPVVIETPKEEIQKASETPKIDQWRIALDYLEGKNYIAASDTWREIIKNAPSKFTIQIELACKEETIQEAYNLFEVKNNFYIVPFKYKGSTCYIIGYGLFNSRKEAEDAYKQLPPIFLNQKFPPRIVFASQVIKK